MPYYGFYVMWKLSRRRWERTSYCFGRYKQNGEFDYLFPQLQNRVIPGFEPESIPEEATRIVRLTPPANTGFGFLEAVPDSILVKMADPTDKDKDGISGKVNWVMPATYHFPSSLSMVDTKQVMRDMLED